MMGKGSKNRGKGGKSGLGGGKRVKPSDTPTFCIARHEAKWHNRFAIKDGTLLFAGRKTDAQEAPFKEKKRKSYSPSYQ